MAEFVHLRWLTAGDARAVARVERAVYPRAGRAGLREIRFDLARAEHTGRNLSLGLFAGARLVGYLLAYLQPVRAAAFEEFEVSHEVSALLEGAAVYVEDVVLERSHARWAARLLRQWRREIQRLHPDCPLDAFCRPGALALWQRHARGFARVGFKLAEQHAVRDLTGGEDWFWLSWRPCATQSDGEAQAAGLPGTPLAGVDHPPGVEARVVRTEAEWARLAPGWERLAARAPEAGPFSSVDLQQCWWRHFGLSRRLLIVTVYRHRRLVGIAPLMVSPEAFLGRILGTLQFIGDHSLMERPSALLDPAEPAAGEWLWRSVLALREEWQAALLYEQAGDVAAQSLLGSLPGEAVLVRASAPLVAPHVAVEGAWANYLSSRSRALRKGFARKLRRLQAAGTLRLAGGNGGAEQALSRYLEVEAKSWKHAAGQGVGSKAGHADYYRELCRALGPHGELRFSFLELDGVAIAASLGLLRAGRLASLEICHDQAYDDCSPGFVLTGLELQACHEAGGCSDYDFLSGTLENKLSWATGLRETRDYYALPNDAHGRLAVAWMFRVKPAIKRLLDRLRLRGFVFRLADRLRARPGVEAAR